MIYTPILMKCTNNTCRTSPVSSLLRKNITCSVLPTRLISFTFATYWGNKSIYTFSRGIANRNGLSPSPGCVYLFLKVIANVPQQIHKTKFERLDWDTLHIWYFLARIFESVEDNAARKYEQALTSLLGQARNLALNSLKITCCEST